MLYPIKHFSVHELLPPAAYQAHGKRGLLFFDINALITLDMLRDRYGPITINNWYWGGNRKYSGWRPWDCPIGAILSQHKFGRAFDCLFRDVTADDVREDMRKSKCFEANNTEPIPYVFHRMRRIENFEGMGWFHFDTAPVLTGLGIQVIGESLTLH